MARKKKKLIPIEQFELTVEDPIYYAYYDQKSGDILCVSNEKNSSYDYCIEISFQEFENLVSGKEKFTDYKVDYIIDDSSQHLGLVSVNENTYVFKNNIFQWISLSPTNETELIVEWNGKTNHWVFLINDISKTRINKSLIPNKLEFYVLLESDLDFIIRTINIDTKKLVEPIYIPFDSSFEYNIDKISIATKRVFNSYGLRVVNE